MALKKYTYTFGDAGNDTVEPGKLKDEIAADAGITVAIDRVDTTIDAVTPAASIVDVWMKDAMPDDVADASPSLAAIVAAHDGVPYPSPVQTVAPTFENTDGLHPRWEGHLYTAVAGATNIFDELVTTEKQLRAGWYELMDNNAVVGDYIEEAVVDKDDVLGLFSTYGLTVGVDVLELKKYVKTKYINPLTAGDRVNFGVGSTFVITAGLYLRTIYHSTGANNVQLEVVTLAYE